MTTKKSTKSTALSVKAELFSTLALRSLAQASAPAAAPASKSPAKPTPVGGIDSKTTHWNQLKTFNPPGQKQEMSAVDEQLLNVFNSLLPGKPLQYPTGVTPQTLANRIYTFMTPTGWKTTPDSISVLTNDKGVKVVTIKLILSESVKQKLPADFNSTNKLAQLLTPIVQQAYPNSLCQVKLEYPAGSAQLM